MNRTTGEGEQANRSAPLEVISTSLRRERQRAGVSLSELAKRANIAKSTLSQLEAGTGNPSVETLWALGVALDVPFSRLVDPPSRGVHLVRNGEAPMVGSEQANYAGALLSASPPHARRDIHLITMESGAARHADPHMPGTVEHVIVTTGKIRTGPATEPIDLDAGDYMSFAGDVAHVYEGLAAGATAVLIMEYS